MPTARTGAGATRGPDGKIYVIGGWSSNGLVAAVEVYDPRTNAWTPGTAVPRAFVSRSVTTHDGMIHAINYFDGPHFAFDLVANTWIERAHPPLRQSRFGMTLVPDGRIFLLGSYPRFGIDRTAANAYEPATNTWNTLPSMPNPRQDMPVAAGSNGLVYAIGGTYPGRDLVDVFHPASNTWSPVSSVPMKLGGMASAATSADGNTIYVVGNGRLFFIYDAAQDMWKRGPDLSEAHAGLSGLEKGTVVATDGRVFVVGGGFLHRDNVPQDPPSVFTRVMEVYDPKRNSWVAGSP